MAALNIEKIIEQAVSKAVNATMLFGVEKGKYESKNLFKHTESRLYAYPELRSMLHFVSLMNYFTLSSYLSKFAKRNLM